MKDPPSPVLFAMVMDRLRNDVRHSSPWTIMVAHGIVICIKRREYMKGNLERWRCALEKRRMKVSCSKTENA